MPFFRAVSMLPPMFVRALVSLPLMLLATGLWAAAHHDHPTATDLAIQAMLLLFMASLLINVVISVVAILRERDTSDPAEHRAGQLASELEPQRPGRTAPAAPTSAPAEAPSDRVTAKQALCEG
jgi:hypothetical protein